MCLASASLGLPACHSVQITPRPSRSQKFLYPFCKEWPLTRALSFTQAQITRIIQATLFLLRQCR
jgi:hypothetical protein